MIRYTMSFALLAAFLPAVASAQQPQEVPITADRIQVAINDAVTFLRALQQPDGSIGGGYQSDGETALAALAMLAAGGNPASDDQLSRTLDWLAAREPDNTYVRGIRANVWEYALRKVPYDKRLRSLLKKDLEWLLAALGDREGWRYSMSSRDWDNSCTQYGVLGIWAASRAGLDPGDEFWKTMSKHFRGCQNSDGGWGYTRGGSTSNMATAGLASMFLVFDTYHGRTCYTRTSPRAFTDGEAAEVLASIERGMNWLGEAQADKDDGYYLYGIERTGVASGRKTIGGEDWFARGARSVLGAQNPDGSIPMGRWGGVVCNTAFCTLFLVYGGAPVAIEKLQYGDGHDWNLNPRDLANLSKQLWNAYERPLNWQTVSIAGGAAEFEAPILFISGSKAVELGESQVTRLRDYISGGGTILAEPSDHSEQFEQSIRELVRRMFPEPDFPSYQLAPLAEDHDVYTVLKQDWEKRPRLSGISDGSRTFFLLSHEYLSGQWQRNQTESDACRLAMNLLFYVTDLGTLDGKFTSTLPATPPAPAREATLHVARVRHSGSKEHPRDWDAAAMSWQVYAPYAEHVTGCQFVETSPIELGKDDLAGIQLVHLTGRHTLRLSKSQQTVLKQFTEDGGIVLVDAYAGSPVFAASARKELEAVFGKLQALPPDHLLAEGQFKGGEDLGGARLKLAARQRLRSRGEDPSGQKLLVAHIDKRPAVVFSELDISAAMAGIENYRSLGYKPKSARMIVGNLIAFAMAD